MSDILLRLVRLLRGEAPRLSVLAADAIRKELPEYSAVPVDELCASTLRNTLRGADCLELGRLPGKDDRQAEPVQTTSRRTDEGLRIDTIIRGYRVSLNVIHERFIALAEELGLDPKETLTGSTLLWGLGDWFVDLSVEEYRTRTVDAAVRRSIEKSEVLHALTGGAIPGVGLLRRSTALGLSVERDYRVVLGSSRDLAPEEWVRRIERYGTDGSSAALATETAVGVIGLVVRAPLEAAREHPLAVGPSSSLSELGYSVAVAERILACLGPQSPGLHTLETVSWRIALPGQPELAALLRSRYLDPLRDESGFGQVLLDSVWAYLAGARNVRAAARRLTVHENTLRYRIGRFESLTGCDLADENTSIELAWLREVQNRSREL